MADYYSIYKQLVRCPEMSRLANTHIPNGRSLLAVSQGLELAAQRGARKLGFNSEVQDMASVLAVLEAFTYVPYGELGEKYLSEKMKAYGKDLSAVRKEKMRSILKGLGVDIPQQLDNEIEILVESRTEQITPVTPGCVVSAASQISSRQDELLLDAAMSGRKAVELGYSASESMAADLTPKVRFINVEKYIKAMPAKSEPALTKSATELLDILDYTKSKQNEK